MRLPRDSSRFDPAHIAGIGNALRKAYPPQVEPDSNMAGNIGRIEPAYLPDAAADARYDQLLERLKQLPWDEEEE